jgi:hypothetical protein
MKKITISESKLIKLIETAMDLELYTQTSNQPFGNYNDGVESTTEEIIEKLKELLNMFEGGKEVSTEKKQRLHRSLDNINKIYNSIKYQS